MSTFRITIPPPRVPFREGNSENVSQEWYRFLYNFFKNVSGDGSVDLASLDISELFDAPALQRPENKEEYPSPVHRSETPYEYQYPAIPKAQTQEEQSNTLLLLKKIKELEERIECIDSQKVNWLKLPIDLVNFVVEKDGTLVFKNDGTVWRDENSGAVSLGIGSSPPDAIAINGGTIYARAFDGVATIEQLFGGVEYNHEAKEGADIVFHVHWSPTTAAAGNVKWQLTYKWIDINGSFAGAETTISVTQAAGGVAWAAKKVSFPAISGTGHTIGSQIAFRLFRDPTDAADTYGADAAITSTIGFHYEIDTLGSRQITTK